LLNDHLMKVLLIAATAALLVGCHKREPKVADRIIRQLHASYPAMTDECLEKLKWGGPEAMPERSDECFKFDRQRRWKGVWTNDFEGSTFCPAGSKCPIQFSAVPQLIWLEFAPNLSPKESKLGATYELEFIGRRSIGKGQFGHMGVSENDIIVDRIISMKELRAPPPHPLPERAKQVRKEDMRG